MRTTRASRGITSPTAIEAASAGQKLDATNGKLPPSGKAIASAMAGATAQAPRPTGHQRGRSSHHAAAASATKAPATGLASARRARPGRRPSPWRPRAAASTAPSPTARPSAKVRRPLMSVVAVATANHSAATRPPRRCRAPGARRSRRRRPRSARRPAAARAARASGGKSSAVAGHVMAAVPAVVPQHEAEVGAVVLRRQVRARRSQHEVDRRGDGGRRPRRDRPRRPGTRRCDRRHPAGRARASARPH